MGRLPRRQLIEELHEDLLATSGLARGWPADARGPAGARGRIGETGAVDPLLVLLAVAAVALAVVTVVQGRHGRLVFEPRSGAWRTPESIERESRWAAVEYVGGAVALVGFVVNLVLVALLGLVIAAAGYVMVVVVRRADR